MLGQILFAVPRSLVPIEHRAGLGIMDEKELTVMEATAEGLQKARETEVK